MKPTLRLLRLSTATLAALATLAATASGAALAQSQTQTQGYEVGFGPQPQLPAPDTSLIPTVNIAPATGWPAGGHPTAAAGMQVAAYATNLDHPRWLYMLPNGDILVAETNKPSTEKKERHQIKAAVMRMEMKKAGAGVASPDRITLLRGIGADGMAATKTVFMEGLHSPFGMVLVGNELYIANADAIVKVPYTTGATKITATPTKFADLPAGLNHHWTKNIIASKDGKYIYATVGSNSNIGENGLDKEEGRAAIWQFDRSSGKGRIYASGLRNPNGLAWNPQSGMLWTAVNERDELGNNLVPDYITSVKDGAFYGWPYSYYGQHVDSRVQPQQPAIVAKAIAPDYAMGAHTASLGLTFYEGDLFPRLKNGALVGQHGSWNRKPRSGYKVVFVPFANGKPSGPPQDILTGFVSPEGQAWGRPVGVIADKSGAILTADDVGNVIWRLTPAGSAAGAKGAGKPMPAAASAPTK